MKKSEKICSRCKKPKSIKKCFRFRVDNRRKPPLKYYNNVCRDCEREDSKRYYKKESSTEAGRKKINASALKRYHERYRDKQLVEMKKKRGTSKYKKYIKSYRERNKEKIARQEEITKRRYHEKNRDKVTDKYCENLLRTQGVRSEQITPEMIELKRSQVLLSRIKEKVNKLKNKK